jgi:hypothetical protein
VPTYDVPIVTATEDPNRDDRLFVDTLDNNGKGSNDRVMRRVEYTRSQNPAKEKSIVIPDLDDTSTSAQLRRALANLKQARQELDIAKQQFDARIPSPE